MELSNFSEEELKAELAKREESKLIFPQRVEKTDTEIVKKIYKTVKSCLDSAIENDYWDGDNSAYIEGAVMMAFFGDDYYDEFHKKRFD
jgi:hypothetical protein